MPEGAVLIAVLIIDRPLCLDCIATRANIDGPLVQEYLDRIRTQLTVFHEDNDQCRACGSVGKVFSLSRLPL